METYEPFKAGNTYKMRHGNVWATFLVSDQIMYSSEHDALKQIRNSMELPGVKKLTITPDFHVGYGFAIGSVVESETHLFPDVVGPDPACSVALSSLGPLGLSTLPTEKKRKVLEEIQTYVSVHHGRVRNQHATLTMKFFKEIIRGEFRGPKSWVNSMEPLWKFQNDSTYKKLIWLLERIMTPKMLEQIGSIGGGNHFLELQEDSDGNNYLMTHFGSRGIGAAGAKWFDGAIAEELKKWNAVVPNDGLTFIPADSELGQLYFMFQQAMLDWTTYNHRDIHYAVSRLLSDSYEFLGHIPHNFIELRNGKYIGRKGATPAYDNDGIPLLIPGSMATGSYIMRPGPEAPKLGESVAHGAGRVLSRGAAKKILDQATINSEFEAIGMVGNFTDVPLDESHGAYKDVDEVIQSLVDAGVATVEKRLTPVLVVKGT